MPMIDAFIPSDALAPDAERALVSKVTELMVTHEMRRIVDLIDDAEEVKASYERATSIAWLFVHRTDVYVGGGVPSAPHYKFQISIPEGQIDEPFRSSIAPDITRAVGEAEGRRWPHVDARVWVHVYEVPDGNWGAGRAVRLREIVDYVAPGMGELAEQRFAAKQREVACETVAMADDRNAPA
jgi:phenylpyruvate tautomerase PptA (4-oxalocrotonate tautomerase family)